jgi:hypothetical protein
MAKSIVSRWLSALTLVALVGTRASAGYKAGPADVTISSSGFSGSLADARASADKQQWIGCALMGNTGETTGYCYAVDAAGNNKYCTFWHDAGVAQAISAMTPYSVMYVSIDSNGVCYNVATYNFSYSAPVVP